MVENLNNEEFKSRMAGDNVVLLDVRTPEEFGEGHIPNSKNVNVLDPAFTQQIAEFNKGSEYLLYCRSGGRSHQAVQLIQSQGFENVAHLANGILGWDGSVE